MDEKEYIALEETYESENLNLGVDFKYIDSDLYLNKFLKITNDKKTNLLLCDLARKILHHRNNTLYEDMYWINPSNTNNSPRIIASETHCKKIECIKYSWLTKFRIRKNLGYITIHSHPCSMPPSIADFNSNYRHRYSLGVICCHNGKVFIYESNQIVNHEVYEAMIEKYLDMGYDEYNAQLLALHNIKEQYKIQFREVI